MDFMSLSALNPAPPKPSQEFVVMLEQTLVRLSPGWVGAGGRGSSQIPSGKGECQEYSHGTESHCTQDQGHSSMSQSLGTSVFAWLLSPGAPGPPEFPRMRPPEPITHGWRRPPVVAALLYKGTSRIGLWVQKRIPKTRSLFHPWISPPKNPRK